MYFSGTLQKKYFHNNVFTYVSLRINGLTVFFIIQIEWSHCYVTPRGIKILRCVLVVRQIFTLSLHRLPPQDWGIFRKRDKKV